MTQITHLRGIAALRPLRGRHPAVVVCLDEGGGGERGGGAGGGAGAGGGRGVLGRGGRVEREGGRAVRWLEIRWRSAERRRHGPARGRLALTVETLDTPHGPARVHLHGAGNPRAALVLGHGAGGGVAAPDLVAVTRAALECDVSVALVEQPYRVAGRRSPPRAPVLDAAWLAIAEQLAAGPLDGLPLITGGRSAGARVACRTAAATGAIGVLCLAFPLVAPSGSAARTSSTTSPSPCSSCRAPAIASGSPSRPSGARSSSCAATTA